MTGSANSTTSVINEYPEVVAQLREVYNKWWTRMLPGMVNEDAYKPSENDKLQAVKKKTKKDDEKRSKRK